MKPIWLFVTVSLILIASTTNCFAQNHYTKDKPILAGSNSIDNDKFGTFRLAASQSYDSVLLGCWFWPHDAPASITFKKDHTFALGDCGEPANDTTISGTYTLKGADGWLVFNDGHKEQFRIVFQKMKEKWNTLNTKNQWVLRNWRYMLALQYGSTNHFNYLE